MEKQEVIQISGEGLKSLSNIDRSYGLNLIADDIVASVSADSFANLRKLAVNKEKVESKDNNLLF